MLCNRRRHGRFPSAAGPFEPSGAQSDLYGHEPERAIYASTFTPSRRMRLHDRGAIAPGKIADFLVVSDIREFAIDQVYKNGRLAFDVNDDYRQQEFPPAFPAHYYESVKLPLLTEADFAIRTEEADGRYACRVMMVNKDSTFTREHRGEVDIRGGELLWQESPMADRYLRALRQDWQSGVRFDRRRYDPARRGGDDLLPR